MWEDSVGRKFNQMNWASQDGYRGTGYTGEAGYEIFIPNSDAPKLWRKLVEVGATPVGLERGIL